MMLEIQKLGQTPNRPPIVPNDNPSAGSPFVEKRREARYATCESVEVCILEMAICHLAGVMRDVSRNGLRVEVGMPVNRGSRLEIVLRNRAIIFGEARYCCRSADTYQVGVVIEDIYYPKPVSVRHTRDDERSVGRLGPSKNQAWIDGFIPTHSPKPSGEIGTMR